MFNGGIKKAAPKGSVAGVSLIFNLKLVEAESRISKIFIRTKGMLAWREMFADAGGEVFVGFSSKKGATAYARKFK